MFESHDLLRSFNSKYSFHWAAIEERRKKKKKNHWMLKIALEMSWVMLSSVFVRRAQLIKPAQNSEKNIATLYIHKYCFFFKQSFNSLLMLVCNIRWVFFPIMNDFLGNILRFHFLFREKFCSNSIHLTKCVATIHIFWDF